jgi:poly(3-hydroxybutyrate) depolymerase
VNRRCGSRVRSVVPRLVAIAVVLACATARAEPPCDGCTLDLPSSKGPAPLVVVLHGDREHARDAAARWRAAVKRRRWALLALECPRALGCKASFWQWDGEPSWVFDQIDAVAAHAGIDPARIYLVGWSGGASYIGARAVAWSARIAAIVIHGGGMAPASSDCAARALPAYFLVGDRNPLHQLAKDLRAYFDACGGDVVWDALAGADHAKEEAALTAKKADAILTWLAARSR